MTTANKVNFLTPKGRLVQGHPMEKQDKNMQGQPLMTQAGQPTQRFFCALAFPKTDPEFPAFYAQLVSVARASFPGLFDAAGNCTHPRFSWKLIDGDGVDDNGKPNAQKEGFAGHWVVKFQSSFAPRCFYKDHYQPQEQIQDANLIRRGYFGRVSGTIEGNGNAQKPGLYVNLGMFELSAQGPEIVSGPDAAAVFGGAASAAMPAGATPLPTFPGAGVAGAAPVPAMAARPALPMTPPAVPGAQPAMPGLPASLPVVPHSTFTAGPAGAGAMPPSPPAMPTMPPPPPAGPTLTAAGAATGFSVAQFVGAGWNETTLRQAGYIV